MTEEFIHHQVIDDVSDRRLNFRIKFDVPVEIEYDSHNHKLDIERAHASQLSRKGLTIVLKKSLPVGSEIIVRIPVPNSLLPIIATSKVAWSTPKNGEITHGIEFVHVPKVHLPFLNQFLSENLSSKTQIQERRVKTQIISELLEFKNRRHKRIVGFHDHLLETDISAPFIIVPAAYGETKINSLHIAYYLANNGFNVLRFDPTNHVGESEGEHLDYTFPLLKEDIESSIDYVRSRVPNVKIGIVAASLAARAAFKVISEDVRPSVMISLAGVVNTRYTLNMVQNVDLVGTHMDGKNWGTINVAGFDIKADNFLVECVNKSFHDLNSTRTDLSKSNCPVVFLFAQKDPWVDIKEGKMVAESLPSKNREIHLISAMHKLKENPTEARKAFRTIVESAAKYLNHSLPKNVVVEPRVREIGVQGRLEKERIRYISTFSKDDAREFWGSYLKRFNYIYSVSDYRDLLDKLYSELSPINNNDTLLDAGCGNGNFGLWLLSKISEKCEKSGGTKKIFFHYTGTDIISEALSSGRKLIEDAQIVLKKKLGLSRNFMSAHFQRVDMNSHLPFINDSFDKICCNLVISYLENPVVALRELIRVLKPGGTMVVTTLKKDSDVSQIYRNFVEKASNEDEIEEARNLLSNAGKILMKESEGFFQFFTIPELQRTINQAYPNISVRFTPCFSNQAILLTISK